MKQTVNFTDFRDAFRVHARLDTFSYEGAKALFDYLESIEADTGEEIELDVVSLCCDYSEYANLAELQEDYADIVTMDDLTDQTTVIMVDGERFIIQQF